jgi:Na+-transporting NADH:ubiquinone oxidoreductase subunit A
MAEFKLSRGYDIPLAGEAEKTVVSAPLPDRVALRPVDFRGLKARPLVEEGALVEVGTPIIGQKGDDSYVITSPVSGKVVTVNRGERRVLHGVEIAPDGKQTAKSFKSHDAGKLASLSREVALAQVLEAGLMPHFRARPFNNAANPAIVPRDIFVTGFDSAPLAPDEALFITGNEATLQAGLDVCSRLTNGKVHLCLNGARTDLPKALTDARNVLTHRFSGPHPAGTAGVQIHHIAPIRRRTDVVWTIDLAGVIAIGKVFLLGKGDGLQLVKVAGSAAKTRRYYKALTGTRISSLLDGQTPDGDIRCISGNVLTGSQTKADGYLGFHDHLLTLIPEAKESQFLGWTDPGFSKLTYFRTHLSRWLGAKNLAPDTRYNGGFRAFVATGYYEQVLPMDIYPLFLIKSILAGDIAEMEGLGIYELTEDEIALCEFICPSKGQLQKILRDGLSLMEMEA